MSFDLESSKEQMRFFRIDEYVKFNEFANRLLVGET